VVRSRRSFVRTVWCAALALAVTTGTPAGAGAQGAVSGQVSLLERPGERSTDLANAVIYLEPAVPARVSADETAGAQIAMLERQFLPHVVLVSPGSSVSFPNRDGFSHNIFSNTPGAAFDLGLYGRGEARSALFKRAGVHPVYCNIHARMSGYVVVVSTPHRAQAGVDGRWTIEGVPAGRYVAHFWHERAAEQTRELVVPREGAAGVDARLDARGYRATPHKNKFGQDYTKGKDRY
jgi:plastocyanin